ncbi:hypothetical protein DS891_06430 [Pseudoalteromonas sp. JC28]|nr:hypothetical protein [Pseudoalteromonas sp. JC28]
MRTHNTEDYKTTNYVLISQSINFTDTYFRIDVVNILQMSMGHISQAFLIRLILGKTAVSRLKIVQKCEVNCNIVIA